MQSVERTFQITRADKDLLAKPEYDVQVGFCKLHLICQGVSTYTFLTGNQFCLGLVYALEW